MPHSYLRIWDRQMSQIEVDPADEPRVDTALTAYLETGRDSIVHLTLLNGAPYSVLASEVTAYMTSTPESRRRNAEVVMELEKEQKDLQQEFSLVPYWDQGAEEDM